MGCLNSKPFDEEAIVEEKLARADKDIERAGQYLVALVRPDIYRNERPSFYSAYARAARRYGFEAGRYAGFAKRNNVVVKVRGLRDKGTDHEVPATSIQNGEWQTSIACKCY